MVKEAPKLVPPSPYSRLVLERATVWTVHKQPALNRGRGSSFWNRFNNLDQGWSPPLTFTVPPIHERYKLHYSAVCNIITPPRLLLCHFWSQGSKAQLEKVWEETDGLDPDDFDPKTFFKLHGKHCPHGGTPLNFCLGTWPCSRHIFATMFQTKCEMYCSLPSNQKWSVWVNMQRACSGNCNSVCYRDSGRQKVTQNLTVFRSQNG